MRPDRRQRPVYEVNGPEALAAEALLRTPLGQPTRTTIAADRDRPGYYLNIVEFASYEAAMENSSRPEIGEFAARLAKLCDSPPKFHNLDVREVWQSSNPT